MQPGWCKVRSMLKGSYRTTSLGLLTIASAVIGYLKAAIDNDPSTVPNWEVASVGIAAGWGLLTARDNKVSSEDAGLK